MALSISVNWLLRQWSIWQIESASSIKSQGSTLLIRSGCSSSSWNSCASSRNSVAAIRLSRLLTAVKFEIVASWTTLGFLIFVISRAAFLKLRLRAKLYRIGFTREFSWISNSDQRKNELVRRKGMEPPKRSTTIDGMYKINNTTVIMPVALAMLFSSLALFRLASWLVSLTFRLRASRYATV